MKLAYTAASTRLQSRIAGIIADVPVPDVLMPAFLKVYCERFGVNLDEAEIPASGFDSFNSFFTRRLKPGARPVDMSPDAVVSPCDGKIQSYGVITNGMLFQAKGCDYRLADLLADESDAARFEGGRYLTIYLSPGDYHRVHFPVDGSVLKVKHIQGGLLSVSPAATEVISGLFCRNERVSGLIETADGLVCMVMVGATSVGRISLAFSDIVSNNGRAHGVQILENPAAARKGDDYGVFNLGSTVILLIEAASDGREWIPGHPDVGGRIRFGNVVFTKR
jgi:phosphatidylserine decarboxylase